MSQLRAKQLDTITVSSPSSPLEDFRSLPSYLRQHVNLGFNQDDVAALLSSIDSSQDRSSTPRLAHLPAELLLQVLEYVPIDHVLDWRLVCRSFRDAIDGRVLYHHLRRTELVGYMGARQSRLMDELDDEHYKRIHLLEARFQHVEKAQDGRHGSEEREPVWSGTHAIFRIDDEWYRNFHSIGGASARQGNTIEDADRQWITTLDRIELRRPEEGFGTLRWCIRLDHAVLDLDFPTETDRIHFDIDIGLHSGLIRVAWKDMLVRFLKTERLLRLMLNETRDLDYTFSHTEDCLRQVRRARLAASLNLQSKTDRHIKWSLSLLHPLFARSGKEHTMMLETVENDAIHTLLLLRRAASLSRRQLAHLDSLAADFRAMEDDLRELDESFAEFKSYLSMPSFQMNVLLPAMIANAGHIPKNPVAWTDELRQRIECQVERWKGQKGVVEQVKALLEGSNEAMTVPEDSFDELGSDF